MRLVCRAKGSTFLCLTSCLNPLRSSKQLILVQSSAHRNSFSETVLFRHKESTEPKVKGLFDLLGNFFLEKGFLVLNYLVASLSNTTRVFLVGHRY